MLKFFHILFFVILISCSNRNENDINDISNKLNTIKLQFEKLDPNLVVIALEGYKSNSKMIKNCVDSIEKEFNYRFVQYKTIKKVSPQFLNIYNNCKKNISFESNQLKNLKYDIENKLLDDDSIKIYLDLEKDNISQIEEYSLKSIELYNYIRSNNDTLYPYITNYVEKYCNRNED